MHNNKQLFSTPTEKSLQPKEKITVSNQAKNIHGSIFLELNHFVFWFFPTFLKCQDFVKRKINVQSAKILRFDI